MIKIIKKACLATAITTALFSSQIVLAADVEVSLPDAASAFTVDQPAGTELMRVNGDGNVGLGTIAPSGKLDVQDANGRLGLFGGSTLVQRDSGNTLIVQNTSTAAGNLGQIILERGDGSGDDMSLTTEYDGSNGVESLGIASGSNMLMSVMKSGNVGIGKISPTQKLDIEGNIQNRGSYIQYSGDDNRLIIGHDIDLGDWIQFRPENAEGMAFLKGPDSIAMVVNNAGNVGIGTTAPANPLEMASGAHVTVAGVWTNASDISKKKNIKEINYGLETVMKLKPSEYDYKIDGSHSIGFIAQEIEKIVPEVVSGEEGNKGVAYGSLTAVLVKALQQQQQQISEQQSRIEALEAKLK